MSALGRLVASVVLTTSEFEEGTSKAKYLAAKMAGDVDRAVRDMERSVVGTMGSVATAFAAGFGINALKNTFDEFVKFRDTLEKTSVVTGASVQSLSVLGQAAKLAGTDIGAVEGALVKMTKGLSASNADTKDTARALEYLGVSGRDAFGNLRDPGDVMQEVARKLGGVHDGANKTALALALWGRSGAQMLPTMRELAENGDLVAKVTERQALQAHEYERSLVRLHLAMEASGRIVMDALVAPLTALIETLTKTISGTDGLSSSIKGLAARGELSSWAQEVVGWFAKLVDFAKVTSAAIMALGSSIIAVASDLALGAAVLTQNLELVRLAEINRNIQAEEANRRWAILLDMNTTKTYDAYREQLKINKLLADAQAGMFGDQASRTAERNREPSFRGTDHNATSPPVALNELENALATAMAKVSGYSREFDKLAVILTQGFITGRISATEYGVAMGGLISQQPAFIAGIKTQADAQAHVIEMFRAAQLAMLEEINARDEILNRIEDQVRDSRDEIAMIGMSQRAREKYTLTLKEERDVKRALADPSLSDDDAARIEAKIRGAYAFLKSQVDTKAELQDQVKVWDTISDRAGAFFGDLVVNGKSAFDKLKQELRSFVQEIIALFAKKYVLSMVASAVGAGSTGDALASAGMSAGMNTLAGTALSAGGSYIAGLFGAGATTSTGYLAGLAVAESGGAASAGMIAAYGAAGQTATAAGVMAGVETALASIPVYGWIALAVLAVAAYFSSKGGGPKGGGSFNESFDASGNVIAGGGGARLYTPSNADAQMAVIGQSIASSYYNTLKQLGGSARGAMGFGIGFDTDPNGTAPNRITSGVSLNGQSVFSTLNRDIGRDEANIGPQMQLEASRMLLAALRASQLPAYLAKVFDDLTPSTATQQQIDDALKQGQALKYIFDTVSRNPLKDVATAIAASQNQYETAMNQNAASIRAVMAAYNGSLAATQNLASATTAYYNAQMQLLAGITQVSQAIDDMFGATFRNIELGGMDTQAKYNFYQQEAADLQAQALAASDPQQIQALANKINADISAAFALLSPDQQNQQRGAFLTQGRATQASLDERLLKIQKDGADATTKIMEDIKKVIGAGAEDQKAAAAQQLEAAKLQAQAAVTPLQLIIVTRDGQQVVTF